MVIENRTDSTNAIVRYECIDWHGRIIEAGSKHQCEAAFERDTTARYVVQIVDGSKYGAPVCERHAGGTGYYRSHSSCS